MKPGSRASDERTLEWIALRIEGWTPTEIGWHYGTSRGAVARATSAVRDDDIAHAREEKPAGAYW